MGKGENTAKGALGGAAIGASLGGPVGAGIGGVLGGLGGYFGDDGEKPSQEEYQLAGFDRRNNELNGAIRGAAGVQAPQAQAGRIGQFQNAGNGAQFRGGQQQLIGQLQAQANGQGPSLATGQFNRSLESGIAAQQAQANSGRGNTALAGRLAAQNIGGLTQDLAGQASQARIQEQISARQQLAGVLGQARGQDIGVNQFNAGQQNQRLLSLGQFGQEANMSNRDAILRNQAQQNQYGISLRNIELQNAEAQQRGDLAFLTGQQQQQSLGDQILAGGTQSLAQGFGSGSFGGGGGGSSAPAWSYGGGPIG